MALQVRGGFSFEPLASILSRTSCLSAEEVAPTSLRHATKMWPGEGDQGGALQDRGPCPEGRGWVGLGASMALLFISSFFFGGGRGVGGGGRRRGGGQR